LSFRPPAATSTKHAICARNVKVAVEGAGAGALAALESRREHVAIVYRITIR
jgi:hypothetical protein